MRQSNPTDHIRYDVKAFAACFVKAFAGFDIYGVSAVLGRSKGAMKNGRKNQGNKKYKVRS